MSRGLEAGRKFDRSAAANLWRHTLSRIPTLFGRLVFLGSLRDANSGVYQHYGLAARCGEEEAAATLRRSHQEAFAEWLCLPLNEQKDDLVEFMGGLGEPRATVLETWERLKSYRSAIPATAPCSDRLLFNSDVEALLELLRNEAGVACPDPDA